MKIGINAQRVLMANPAGPEIYTINIIKALAKEDHKNEYVLYFTHEPAKKFWEDLSNRNPKFTYKVLKKFISWTQISLAYELFKNPVDVLFSAVHTIPIFNFRSVKLVSMIHGLEYKYSESAKNLFQKFMKGKHEWYVSMFSERLVVPSDFTKEAIFNSGWAGLDKITVIPEGVDSQFKKYSEKETAGMRQKYSLGRDYIIFISTIQPRKNLPKLIEGFSKFVRDGNSNLDLVVVGKNGWDFEESLRAPKLFGVEERVKFLGRVSQDDLPVLLSGARAYASASLEEGFGLPLLEAMASEVPCLVSEIPAYKQLAGDSVWYMNHRNADEIYRKITDFYNGNYDPKLIDDAKRISDSYRWESAAQRLIEVFSSFTKDITNK